MKLSLIYILFIVSFTSIFSNTDAVYKKDYGNVKVHIKTGDRKYEEIEKVFIYAQLVEKLCKELNYKEQVFLDFDHAYTSKKKTEPSCFVSLSYGYSIYDSKEEHPVFSEKVITIHQISNVFSAETTLKLVQFAIENVSEIKNQQKKVKYTDKYMEFLIESYETLQIREVIQSPKNELITKVMSNRIDRLNRSYKEGISYYFKDNKFIVFKPEKGEEKEKELVTIDNIYQFEGFWTDSALIFDTDESFIYLRIGYSGKHVSKRHIIENIKDNYNTFEVERMNHSKIFIRSYFWSKEREGNVERLLAYVIYSDSLIQDLNKVIEKEINSPKIKEEKGIWNTIKSFFKYYYEN